MELLGRRSERAALGRLLTSVRGGRSAALVVRGEAGIGKSALLEDAGREACAAGMGVEDVTGVEFEMQFAFAGLHQLCAPFMDRSAALPDAQRLALGVAFGQESGEAPDTILLGVATSHLLAEVASKKPLLCRVDDAQWLDPASARVLAFVTRRMMADRFGLLLAMRDMSDGEQDPFADVPELRPAGLSDADARTFLAAAGRVPLDERVRERSIAEARGNPLALLESTRAIAPSRFAGGFESPDAADVPHRIEDAFRRRSAGLPRDTRMLLLLAAAEPTGEAALLWRAAAKLRVPVGAASPAEAAGLLEIGAKTKFRHPLVRSAVYRAATPHDRRRAHGALAAATDVRADPDRRAWHRGRAVIEPNSEVAAELESSAERARNRGGWAAAAMFLRLAAELSPEAELRARRSLDAAHAAHESGSPESALELLTTAARGPLDDRQRARGEFLRARISFQNTRAGEAAQMLLHAAGRITPLGAERARECYLWAIEASFHAGRLSPQGELVRVARAAQSAPAAPPPPRPVDLMLDGLAQMFVRGFEASVPTLRRALRMLRASPSRLDEASRSRLWLACHIGAALWDDEAILELADLDVRLARDAGALARLPAALNAHISVLVLSGELMRAEELIAQEQAITEATGVPPLPNARLVLAAWSGREAETLALRAAMVDEATRRGEGATLGLADIAFATLRNGSGHYADACTAAARPLENDELTFSSIALPEFIEAAARSHQPERATAALDMLNLRARASGTDWARGLAARSSALLARGPEAEEQYREAIAHLARCRMLTHLARAHLVFGEWLRREGRRREAGEHLRTAHEMLLEMGVGAFAARAARELRATGDHPRRRATQATDELTPQELHIARLVATGATSRDVAAQLFLSPRTIDAHLRNIFRKLDITSRRELKRFRLPRPHPP